MGVLIAAAGAAIVGWMSGRKKKKAAAREAARAEAARKKELEAMSLDAQAAALTARTQDESLQRTRAIEAESARYAAVRDRTAAAEVQTGADETVEGARRRSYADPFGL